MKICHVDGRRYRVELDIETREYVEKLLTDASLNLLNVFADDVDTTLKDAIISRLVASAFYKSKYSIENDMFVIIEVIDGDRSIKVSVGEIVGADNTRKMLCGPMAL